MGAAARLTPVRARSPPAGAGLAEGAAKPYLGPMPLPRPSSPRALWADMRAFAGQRGPHQLVAAALAIAMPAALIVLFIVDGRTNIAPGPQLIYAESWSATRTDAEIIADQKKHQAEREAKQAERQRQFKKLDDDLEKLGI